VDAVKRQIKAIGAKRVVIDSLSPLVVQERSPIERRREIAYLFKGLMETGCTYLLTAEAKTTDLQRGFSVEEYLSHGVIQLQSVVKGDRLVRDIRVAKMRGVGHDIQPHPYLITERGIEVFPKEIVL
jgi:KaiC/GvpD/RAD55 family RecA-like ATPase